MDKLEQELVDEARAALECEAEAERHRARVRDLLPEVRRKNGKGPAELERMIGSLYVSATISRWTSGEVPAGAKRQGKRKRPGAAPAGSS